MAISIDLDLLLVKKKMKLGTLADKVGISIQNLSILKTGKAKAIRFSTLEAICAALDCQPGDILRYHPDEPAHLLGGSHAPFENELRKTGSEI